jgi:hypothetical protein
LDNRIFRKQVFFMSRTSIRSLLSVLAILASAQGASAASARCTVVLGKTSCQTQTIAANRTNHFLQLEVSKYATFRVIDSTNGKVVASGKSGFFGIRRTITGLYANYYAVVGDKSKFQSFGDTVVIRND